MNAKNSHASPTPVIEDGRVYVHFGTNGTACLATTTGSILWKNNSLKLEHKEGPGSSPILYGQFLIVNCDGMDVQYVVALDKHTGRIAWKTDRTGKPHDNPDFRKAYSIRGNSSRRSDAIDQPRRRPGRGLRSGHRPRTVEGALRRLFGCSAADLWRRNAVCRHGFRPAKVVGHSPGRTGRPHRYGRRVAGDEADFSGPVAAAGGRRAVSRYQPRSGQFARHQNRQVDLDPRLGGNYSASPTLAGRRIYILWKKAART